MVTVLFVVFLGCVMLRMPIAFSLGFSSFVYIAASPIPLSIIPERMFTGIDSFVILCVPGFILAGNLMNEGGITRDLVRFARQLLARIYAALPSVDVADALVQADVAAGVAPAQARQGYVRHMAQEPSLIAAARWLSQESFAPPGAQAALHRSIEHAARPLARYRCAACGFETQGYFWQCPGCQAWESFPPRRIEEL